MLTKTNAAIADTISCNVRMCISRGFGSHVPGLRLLVVVSLLSVCSSAADGAVLTDAAIRAFAAYLDRARQAFVDRQTQAVARNGDERAALLGGATTVFPRNGDGILTMPGSLIHHWSGATFMRGVTLDQTLELSHAYREYPKIFRPIVASTVLSDNGDTLRVQFRMRESAGGMTAVLDVWSDVRYVRSDVTHAYVISTSSEIREVLDPGRSTERRLPAGRDSGYLWRAATFTRFVEADGGVYMEMETLGMSRQFPPMLGWIIEPIARRIGRRSVAESAEEFKRAVLTRYASSR